MEIWKMGKINFSKIFLILAFLSLSGCGSYLYPRTHLNELNFIVFPRIIQDGDFYFLQYQFASNEKNGTHTLLRTISKKVENEKLYYFFDSTISVRDECELVNKKIDEEYVKFIKKIAVFWLNPDGSSQKLNISTD